MQFFLSSPLHKLEGTRSPPSPSMAPPMHTSGPVGTSPVSGHMRSCSHTEKIEISSLTTQFNEYLSSESPLKAPMAYCGSCRCLEDIMADIRALHGAKFRAQIQPAPLQKNQTQTQTVFIAKNIPQNPTRYPLTRTYVHGSHFLTRAPNQTAVF